MAPSKPTPLHETETREREETPPEIINLADAMARMLAEWWLNRQSA